MAAEGLRGSLAPGLHSSNPGTQTAPRAVSGPDKGQRGTTVSEPGLWRGRKPREAVPGGNTLHPHAPRYKRGLAEHSLLVASS